jgi:hypothetical protein
MKSADCKWIKTSEREPSIGGYYYCKIDTKSDAIVSTIVEWAEFSNGDHKYYDWDFEGIQHFNGFGEDAEVIEWLDEDTKISNCCKSEIIPPDLDSAEQAGSLYSAFLCYICTKCGKPCEPINDK